MDATNPQPGDQKPENLKRGLRRAVIGLVVLIVLVAIAVALTNLGGDDDPSGGGNEGLAPAAVILGTVPGA